ncbi:NIPSNAP family protein [Sunxiuqinia sp. A32]|uniref:NIPSNAP family protein n=1 Tax=Sunxiuqinia sp. A32 TaxID=3461496 RepID=UPI0040458F17
MKRRNFLRSTALLTTTAITGNALSGANPAQPEKEIYEWRVYHFKNGGQKRKLDEYYRDVLIPTLNEFGVKVGAFNEYGMDEPPKAYYMLVFSSMASYLQIKNRLWSHISFLDKSKDFFKSTEEHGAYVRFETSLLKAFDAIPTFRQPEKERGLLELRTYESNNEEAGQRKIRMFNNEEIALFDKVGLNPTFFGEILAGPQMPALMYMLWFKDMDERKEKWSRFGASPEWKKMSSKKEYENTVSVVNKKFLLPMDFSQI